MLVFFLLFMLAVTNIIVRLKLKGMTFIKATRCQLFLRLLIKIADVGHHEQYVL